MATYKVAFFGHRDLSAHDKVESRLFPILLELMKKYDFVEIYLGRNGEFDSFCASVVKRAQKMSAMNNSEMTLVLPHIVKDAEYYERYYDRIIIPEHLENIYPKRSIHERNKWMAEISDLVICYVERESGGAYTAVKYAESLGKTVINLAYDT